MSVVRLKNGMTNGAASPRQCAVIRLAGKNYHLLGSIATELALQTSNFVTNSRDENGTILCFYSDVTSVMSHFEIYPPNT